MTMTMPEPQQLTLVLADDHAIVREGIAGLCASHGFRILGQCSDGAAAVDLILAEKPDFAVLDVHMPVITGLEAVRRIRAAGSATKLLILSMSHDEKLIRSAISAGADAYLLKDGPSRHLIDAFTFVRDGGIYVSPLLRGAGLFAQQSEETPVTDPLSVLSPREVEVFGYLLNGLRSKDIAERLDISPKTVDTYRSAVMRKLNVRDLVSLVKFAIERNLTSSLVPR
jgi:DNA-binding NarL/FixJ family response regulator